MANKKVASVNGSHLSTDMLFSTFERTIEMQTQLTSDMKQLCDCMNKNTQAMGELVQKLSPIAYNISGMRKSINSIKYILIPIIGALTTTTVALILKVLAK